MTKISDYNINLMIYVDSLLSEFVFVRFKSSSASFSLLQLVCASVNTEMATPSFYKNACDIDLGDVCAVFHRILSHDSLH